MVRTTTHVSPTISAPPPGPTVDWLVLGFGVESGVERGELGGLDDGDDDEVDDDVGDVVSGWLLCVVGRG